MTIIEITMPYGKVVKIEYDDVSVEEVQESFEKLYELASQDRLYYLEFPKNTEGKKMIISPDIFRQCILEIYNA